MTAIFPTAVATTGNIPDTNPLTSLSANNHSGKHNQIRDEIIALETKVGATGSADNTSMDYKLGEVIGGDKVVGKSAIQILLNKVLGVGTAIKLASAAIGDMFYTIDINGTLAKLGIGTNGQALFSNGSAPYWGSVSSINTNYGTDTGTANAYVLNPTTAIGAYVGGLQLQFIAANANTTASTINVSSLGVKTIKKLDGATDLAANDIKVGMLVCLEYNATSGFFQIVNPVGNAPITQSQVGVGANLIVQLDGSSQLPAVSAINLTNVPAPTTKNGAQASGGTAPTTQTITHSLGKIPKRILIYAVSQSNFPNANWHGGFSMGSWDSGGQSCVWSGQLNSTTSNQGTVAKAISIDYYDASGGSIMRNFTGTIQNVTSTTFDIVGSAVTFSGGGVYYSWTLE